MTHKEPQSSAWVGREWRTARDRLLENVRQQPFVSDYKRSVYAILDGRKAFLPAYIPYIGPSYFDYRPRVLCYAINQNLSVHAPWSKGWIELWANDTEAAYDRLNHAARTGRPIPVRPYAEGFIPLVALMSILWLDRTGSWRLPEVIDDVVAVSNFVKFSTPEDASSSSIPSVWWKECGSRYVLRELELLQPDVIVAFGRRTSSEIRKLLPQLRLGDGQPTILETRFPARLASARARPLSHQEAEIWQGRIVPLVARMREPPPSSYRHWRVESFPGYFLDAVRAWGLHL